MVLLEFQVHSLDETWAVISLEKMDGLCTMAHPSLDSLLIHIGVLKPLPSVAKALSTTQIHWEPKPGLAKVMYNG